MSYSSKYWYADPLLYDFLGDVYLYMEASIEKKRKAVLPVQNIEWENRDT